MKEAGKNPTGKSPEELAAEVRAKRAAREGSAATEPLSPKPEDVVAPPLAETAPAPEAEQSAIPSPSVDPSEGGKLNLIADKEKQLAEAEENLRLAQIKLLKEKKAGLEEKIRQHKKGEAKPKGLLSRAKDSLARRAEDEKHRHAYEPGGEFFGFSPKSRKEELEDMQAQVAGMTAQARELRKRREANGAVVPEAVEGAEEKHSPGGYFEQVQGAQGKLEKSREAYATGYKEKESAFKRLLRLIPIVKGLERLDEVPEVKELHDAHTKDLQNYIQLKQLAAEEYKTKGKNVGDLETRAILYEILGGEAVRLVKAKDEAGRKLREARTQEGKEKWHDPLVKISDKWADWWNKKVPPKYKLVLASGIFGVGVATGLAIPFEVAAVCRVLGGTAAGFGWYERGMLKFEKKRDKKIKKEVGRIMSEADAMERFRSFSSAEGGSEARAELLSARIKYLNKAENIRAVEKKIVGKRDSLYVRSVALGGVLGSSYLWGPYLRGALGVGMDYFGLGKVKDSALEYVGDKIHKTKEFFSGGQMKGAAPGAMDIVGETAAPKTILGKPAGIPPIVEPASPPKVFPGTLPETYERPGGGAAVLQEAGPKTAGIPPIEEIKVPQIIEHRAAVSGDNPWKMTKDMIKGRAQEMGFGQEGPRNYRKWLEWKTATLIKDSGGAEVFEKIRVGDKINLLLDGEGKWKVNLEPKSGGARSGLTAVPETSPKGASSALAEEPKKVRTGKPSTVKKMDTSFYDEQIEQARHRGVLAEERGQYARTGQMGAEAESTYLKTLDPGKTGQLTRQIFNGDYANVDAKQFVDQFSNPIHSDAGGVAPTWDDIQKGELRKKIVGRLVEKYGPPSGKVQDWLFNRVSPEELMLLRRDSGG